MRHVIEREQFVARPRSEVFEFFADAANLERLTPTSLHFEIKTALPIEMHTGTLIDYRIRLFGVGLLWRTRIETFEAGTRFIDIQLKGPYRLWRHTHEFRDASGGTTVRDRVEYEMPLGILGELARTVFVRPQLEAIFDFRHESIDRIFGTNSGSLSTRTSPATPGASHDHRQFSR